MAFEGNIVMRISSLALPVLPVRDTIGNANSVNLSTMPLFSAPCDPDPEEFALWKNIYFPSVDETDSISDGALRFSYILLKDVVLCKRVPLELKGSPAYNTLRNNIMNPKSRYAKTYVRMMKRLDVLCYDEFESVVNNLCGFTSCPYAPAHKRLVMWGTIISIFTFAVCLAHKYRQEEDRVEEVSRFLAKYLFQYTLPFIKRRGGWEAIVKEHPANPVEEPLYSESLFCISSSFQERRRKKKSSITTKAVLWSGLCVGSVATTMFLLTRNKM